MSTNGSTDKRKVLLVNPNQVKPPVGPLALDYLAYALEENGFIVDILDLCFVPDFARAIADYFAKNEVMAVAVTLRNADDTFFVTQDFCLDRYREVVERVKNHTGAPIVLGGSGFSVMPRAVLDYYGLELGIWGEGEITLPLLIRNLDTKARYGFVPGLLWRDGNVFRQNMPVHLDLADFNPRRTAIDNRRYFLEGGMAGIETKRGCPRSCIYCVDPVGKGRKLRLRSPRSVAGEFQALLGQGIDYVHLCDSEFNIPPEHAREVCLELIARGLGGKVRWYTYATPAGFSAELAGLLRRAGCVGINFGVDSGSDRILKRLGRDFRQEDLFSAADACRRAGIVVMFDLLLGGPDETPETLRQTIEVMKMISPHRVGASLGIRVFPDTRIAELVRQEGLPALNPNLRGYVDGNGGFFFPVYYVSAALGDDPFGDLERLIDGDERFFFFGPSAGEDRNYNYNDNSVLCEAIRKGYRGAFWDILRRLAQER
ncbi:MAG: radical SAM protein [Dehalococcoidia bacterium]|nr:radical SAM protein [Dehalococcoidia bacterium]